MKKYDEFKMEIVLFDGEAWVVANNSGTYESPIMKSAREDDENALMTYKTYK